MREIDFMAVGESHGDAICFRYGPSMEQFVVDIIDGGYSSIGEDVVKHVLDVYGTRRVQNLVLTHADDDHARGLVPILGTVSV